MWELLAQGLWAFEGIQDSLGFRFLPMEVGLRIVIVSAGDSEFIERYTGFQNPGFQIP